MTKVDTAVRTIFDRYKAAVESLDAAAMTALYADDVHVFDLMGQWEFRGLDEWRANVETWLGDPSTEQSCNFEDVIIIEDGDLAVARAMVNYGAKHDGKEESMWNRGTWALRRINGEWRIIMEHTSVPLNEETMQPVFGREETS